MSVFIQFDSDNCGRCGGQGYFSCYASVAGGACFACKGAKKVLTRKGKAARTRYEAWREATLRRRAEELQPGDLVVVPPQHTMTAWVTFKRPLRVVAVRPATSPNGFPAIVLAYRGPAHQWLQVDTEAETLTVQEQTMYLAPTVAQLREIAPTLGNGATLTDVRA